MDVELKITSDGSHTLFNPLVNECYHSTHGALQESLHVFIRSGLDHVAQRLKMIRILEVGFGTGLNALLTLVAASDHNLRVAYTAVETLTLDDDIVGGLNYPAMIENQHAGEWFTRIHKAPWGDPSGIAPNFNLQKLNCRVQDFDAGQSCFDLVYFDAFAPQKQPDMWSMDVLARVARSMDEGGCLVTYCAKGQVRRDLVSVGLTVERLPGPPGKREMVRATRRRT
jgi:tRNA U34 5-methylaminomethyl-2-thiouridine-forming methyltransferase MnmC